ncbi:hypothetical protein QBC33DRAFT_80301 [Phialemonium atrogriseum]|uniref:Uncharacterized protein n=1 Tax=Phialemonium atrogriseum TaxID=1093897 RepID=A0AAJ0BZ49_9PEZI|nr:uncharacterized protein QBC33DRAFT_80301 [Phialemonium atrogriseum]KAK1767183.1 hypothetical protein QBC33DRAFT_80301 [Phialemonium atrogriseum]
MISGILLFLCLAAGGLWDALSFCMKGLAALIAIFRAWDTELDSKVVSLFVSIYLLFSLWVHLEPVGRAVRRFSSSCVGSVREHIVHLLLLALSPVAANFHLASNRLHGWFDGAVDYWTTQPRLRGRTRRELADQRGRQAALCEAIASLNRLIRAGLRRQDCLAIDIRSVGKLQAPRYPLFPGPLESEFQEVPFVASGGYPSEVPELPGPWARLLSRTDYSVRNMGFALRELPPLIEENEGRVSKLREELARVNDGVKKAEDKLAKAQRQHEHRLRCEAAAAAKVRAQQKRETTPRRIGLTRFVLPLLYYHRKISSRANLTVQQQRS